jgi:hypothetical protein
MVVWQKKLRRPHTRLLRNALSHVMIKRFLSVSVMAVTFSAAYGQSQKEFSGPYPNAPPTSTASEPTHQKDVYTHHRIKPFKWKRTNVKRTAQYEFYKRVEEAAKEHQRILRKLHRPQYSDFLYYGHKRKPKKHSPDQMRYCKECGIRH